MYSTPTIRNSTPNKLHYRLSIVTLFTISFQSCKRFFLTSFIRYNRLSKALTILGRPRQPHNPLPDRIMSTTEAIPPGFTLAMERTRDTGVTHADGCAVLYPGLCCCLLCSHLLAPRLLMLPVADSALMALLRSKTITPTLRLLTPFRPLLFAMLWVEVAHIAPITLKASSGVSTT